MKTALLCLLLVGCATVKPFETPTLYFACDEDEILYALTEWQDRPLVAMIGHCENGRGILGPRRPPEV